MARFKKFVAAPGSYKTPDGPAAVTPERIRHWHETVTQMVRRGIRPPVSWGHNSQALPHTDDDAAYWSARFNAGRIVGSEIDSEGRFYLVGDVPGVEQEGGELTTTALMPDGRRLKTSIGEVSIGVRDWTDGDGRTWKDAPVHLALTPLPVIVPPGGQPGFALALSAAPVRGLTRFSLTHRFATPGGKTVAQTQDPSQIKKLLDVLRKVGLALPPDTDEDNLVERLLVAGHVVAGQGDQGDQQLTEDAGAGAYMSTLPGRAFRGSERDRLAAIADEFCKAARLPARRTNN